MQDNVFDILTSLLTPLIAAVVAYIAYQQHKTNRDKLRFDLYDRRLKVFEGLMVLLSDIFHKGKCTDQERDQFQRTTVEAGFLFDKDIADYLDTIHKNTLKLGAIKAALDLSGVEKEDQAVQKLSGLSDWFTDQLEVSKEKFSRYLSFRQSGDVFERRTMNWKRGFKKIAWVLSVGGFLFWAGVCIYFLFTEGWDPEFWIVLGFGGLNFALVWMVYCAGLYIVRGFCDAQPTGQQKQ